ncbi:unnamed protein product, partial [marine sediment metagenome]
DAMDDIDIEDEEDDVIPTGKTDDASGMVGILAGKKTVAQQAGVIRCLGLMKSGKALPHLDRIAGAEQAPLRQAAAFALGQYDKDTGIETLQALAKDKEVAVAFEAAHSLWQRQQVPDNALSLARQEIIARPTNASALNVLAKEGTAEDAGRLSQYLTDPVAERRLLGIEGLLRLGKAEDNQIAVWLSDPSTAVARTAITNFSRKQLARHQPALLRLANHPHSVLAEAARAALADFMPRDPDKRMEFELAMEHPYVRRGIIEKLARDGSGKALA